jgi:hypothetical protein
MSLDESDIVLAVAKAQGVLLKATQQILKRDKWDGIRAAAWLKAHEEVYSKIRDDAHDMLDDEVRVKAAKLAGEPSI